MQINCSFKLSIFLVHEPDKNAENNKHMTQIDFMKAEHKIINLDNAGPTNNFGL